jgi:hypothetical protein
MLAAKRTAQRNLGGVPKYTSAVPAKKNRKSEELNSIQQLTWLDPMALANRTPLQRVITTHLIRLRPGYCEFWAKAGEG